MSKFDNAQVTEYSNGGDAMKGICWYFLDLNTEGMRKILREQIEEEVEETLEEGRKEGFALASLYFGEENQGFTQQKDELKAQLKNKRSEIYDLWELFITRTVRFQLIYDALFFVSMIVTVVAFLTGVFNVALISFIVFGLFTLTAGLNNIYSNLSYYLTGGNIIFNNLLDAYNQYGALEAKIRLADGHGFSHEENEAKWIYTTSHEITSPV